MVYESGEEPRARFNAELLKTLPPAQLAEQLIDEAYSAAGKLSGEQRIRLEGMLALICYEPNENEAEADAKAAVLELSASMQKPTAESLTELTRRGKNQALINIDLYKTAINTAMRSNSGYSEAKLQFGLQQICLAKREAEIDYGSDYVRNRAIRFLTEPGKRGAVLLHNALTGDDDSYAPGVAALHESLSSGTLSFEDATETLKVITGYLIFTNSRHVQPGVKDMAIDLIGYMRERQFSDASSWEYATLTAHFASVARTMPTLS